MVPTGQIEELGYEYPQSHAIPCDKPHVSRYGQILSNMGNKPKRQLIKWQSHAQVMSHDVGTQEQPATSGACDFPELTPLTI